MKKLLVVLVVLAFLGGGAFAALPLLTLKNIQGALEAGDAKALEANSDWAMLQKNVQEQLQAKAQSTMATKKAAMNEKVEEMEEKAAAMEDRLPKLPGGGPGPMGKLPGRPGARESDSQEAPKPVAAVENMASQVGSALMSKVIEKALTPENLIELVRQQKAEIDDVSFGYDSFDQFRATAKTSDGQTITLHLERRGMGWKLVNIGLPL